MYGPFVFSLAPVCKGRFPIDLLLKDPEAFEPWNNLGILDSPTFFNTRSSVYAVLPPSKDQNSDFS